MKHIIYAFSFATALTAAAPVLAGVGPVDLPRMTFPDTAGPDVGQGCASPTTLSTTRCQESDG